MYIKMFWNAGIETPLLTRSVENVPVPVRHNARICLSSSRLALIRRLCLNGRSNPDRRMSQNRFVKMNWKWESNFVWAVAGGGEGAPLSIASIAMFSSLFYCYWLGMTINFGFTVP